MARFLFVSPHPDDVELGIGGTIIKLAGAGHNVYIVDVTSGEPTPYGTVAKRKKETNCASRLLGVRKRVNLGLPNRYLFDTKETRLLLAAQIRIFKPDILVCPYFIDAHPDHVSCASLTEAARFYAKYTKLDLKGKPHYPACLLYYFSTHLRIVPQASFFIDISKQFQAKMKIITCYRSQFIDNPRNRFLFDFIESQNRYFGLLIRAGYAEAIYSKEVIKIDSLAHLL